VQVPNVVVEWLTLLRLILEVPGLNLGLETGHPEILVIFFSLSRIIPG
jgi:hypothetical protein